MKLIKSSRRLRGVMASVLGLSVMIGFPVAGFGSGYSSYSKDCRYYNGVYRCHTSYHRDYYHHRHHGYYHHSNRAANAAMAGLLVGGVLGAIASHPAPPPPVAPVCVNKRVMVSREKFWRHGKEYERTGWVTRRYCH